MAFCLYTPKIVTLLSHTTTHAHTYIRIIHTSFGPVPYGKTIPTWFTPLLGRYPFKNRQARNLTCKLGTAYIVEDILYNACAAS